MKALTIVIPAVAMLLAASSANATSWPSAAGITGEQNAVTLIKAEKSEVQKATKSKSKQKTVQKRRRVRRSFASLTCSVEANKKGLKGKVRKSYRKKCLKAASACSVYARKRGLKGKARIAYRKQCVTRAAQKATA